MQAVRKVAKIVANFTTHEKVSLNYFHSLPILVVSKCGLIYTFFVAALPHKKPSFCGRAAKQ
jgi:hypothetical protein